ncbi:hypothetical protein OROGR_015382 [Orobanche gracilis]
MTRLKLDLDLLEISISSSARAWLDLFVIMINNIIRVYIYISKKQ